MLYFMIGLPRSGKTTQVKKMASHARNQPVIVSDDEIRLAMGHRYNYYVEPIVFAIKPIMIRSLLNQGYDVIIDDTHTTYESLDRLAQITTELQPIVWPNVDVYMNPGELATLVKVCKERAAASNQIDLWPVIDRMAIQAQRLIPTLNITLSHLKDKYNKIPKVVI